MKQFLLFSLFIYGTITTKAQILGGGTDFSNAVVFNEAWLNNCPNGATTLSNDKVFEPTDPIDPCAPFPACATGTTGSDVWFKFVAQFNTATIKVDPSGGFDIAIQAFSGTACPGLTDIGCVDDGGNNATESLTLTSLNINETYYFRIFGASNNSSARTGTYNFCGSANLYATVLPVNITRFTASTNNDKVSLLWSTASESMNDRFEIQKSADGSTFLVIGNVTGAGNSHQPVDYSFIDPAPYASITYYRLKQIDLNGGYKYSAIVPVRRNQKLMATVTVSPNPVVDKININVESDIAGPATLRILNANGTQVYQSDKILLKGANVFTINNLTHLPAAVYNVQVITPNKKISTQFVRNR
jgi:hypothetical protein